MEDLINAYRQLSDCSLLDVLEGNEQKPKVITVFTVMNQIHANPEHVQIVGIYLDEDKARNKAQALEFAWVDDHTLHI